MNLLKTLMATAAIAAGLTGAAVAKDKIKVGFVYVGPVGDFGWTYEHDKGRLAVEEALGDKVETTYVESVPEGPDAERAACGRLALPHRLCDPGGHQLP